MDLTPMPDAIRRVFEGLNHSAPTYVAGGAVRDLARGARVHDWDLATALRPQEVLNWGRRAGYRVVPTGLDFGTVTIVTDAGSVEVTTFRRDGRYRDNRHPETVSFATTIEEDLSRRDFTINAMAVAQDGTLLDPFGGARDLAVGRIAAVGSAEARFAEDPLRMLRAVRFVGLEGPNGTPFALAPETAEAIHHQKPLAAGVSAERQRTELMTLLSQPHPGAALDALTRTGLLGIIWPEWVAAQGFDQRNPHHPYPVDEHLLRTATAGPTPFLRLVGLLHDIAKPSCFWSGPDGVGHFYGHDRVGAHYARHMLTRMRFDKRAVDHAAALIEHHLFPWDRASDKTIRRQLRQLGIGLVRDLLDLRSMDVIGAGRRWEVEEDVRRRVQWLIEDQEAGRFKLALNGRDIMQITGLSPGPAVGQLLTILEEWVDEDPGRNTPATLRCRVAALMKESPPR